MTDAELFKEFKSRSEQVLFYIISAVFINIAVILSICRLLFLGVVWPFYLMKELYAYTRRNKS